MDISYLKLCENLSEFYEPEDTENGEEFSKERYEELTELANKYREIFLKSKELGVEGRLAFSDDARDRYIKLKKELKDVELRIQEYQDEYSTIDKKYKRARRVFYNHLRQLPESASARYRWAMLNDLSWVFDTSTFDRFIEEINAYASELRARKGVVFRNIHFRLKSGHVCSRPCFEADMLPTQQVLETLKGTIYTAEDKNGIVKRYTINDWGIGHTNSFIVATSNTDDLIRIPLNNFLYSVWKRYFHIIKTNVPDNFFEVHIIEKVDLDKFNETVTSLIADLTTLKSIVENFFLIKESFNIQSLDNREWSLHHDIANIEYQAKNYYKETRQKLNAVEKQLGIWKSAYNKTKKDSGEYLLKTVDPKNGDIAQSYAALDNNEKAFFLGWLCKHIRKIEIDVMEGGKSQRQVDYLGITGYNTSKKSGDNAWDVAGGSIIFDTSNIPEDVQEALNRLTANKLFIGRTRKETGEVVNKRLNSTALSLYLILKFNWPVYQDFTVNEEEAYGIQQKEVPNNPDDFSAGYEQ